LRAPVLAVIDGNAGLRRAVSEVWPRAAVQRCEEFRRRVKTQGSLPTEDAALVLLFSLVASDQIKLRRIDGWRKIPGVVSRHVAVTA